MITFPDRDFSQLNTYINGSQPTKLLFLVDANTHEYCLPVLLANLQTEIPFEIIEIEAGEDLKNIETAAQLWEILSEFETDRHSLMINLGGGVITDLGGFVASTYKRGISFINIPTTLLAMCDASIGGKTGIDHGFLKNIVGTFAEAEQIFVYPEFLRTLPFIELRSGFAEMLKHGLIADAQHWHDAISIKELSAENIFPLIEQSMLIKQQIVQQDFKEQHIRKTLNFGHTIGHAIESLYLQNGAPIPHGEAVAMGMICETHLAYLENLLDEQTATDIVENLRKFYPKLSTERFTNADILALIVNDKKNKNGQARFSLLSSVGKGIFDNVTNSDNIIAALHYYQNMT